MRVVRAEVMSRGLCEPTRGSSSSVMRNTRFVADFGALLGELITTLRRERLTAPVAENPVTAREQVSYGNVLIRRRIVLT